MSAFFCALSNLTLENTKFDPNLAIGYSIRLFEICRLTKPNGELSPGK